MSIGEEVVSTLEDEAKESLQLASEDAIEELCDDGLSKDEAIDLVFDVLDGILAFKAVGNVVGTMVGGAAGGQVGSAVGEGAEAVSDKALEKAAETVKSWERDPDAMEARAAELEAKGKGRKAARIRKRAGRVRDRQGDDG